MSLICYQYWPALDGFHCFFCSSIKHRHPQGQHGDLCMLSPCACFRVHLSREHSLCCVCSRRWLWGHCSLACSRPGLCSAAGPGLLRLSLCAHRSWLNRRQLDGSLNRTPAGFYDRVWQILERTPNGLIVAGRFLPQVNQQRVSGTAAPPNY